MSTVTLTVCDECGKEGRRLIKIDNYYYCSRECYLAVCKRHFDSCWIQALQTSNPPQSVKIAPRYSKVA